MSAKNSIRKQPNLWQWLLMLLAISVVVSLFYNWISARNEHRNRLKFAEELLADDHTEALQIFEKWRKHIHSSAPVLNDTNEYHQLEKLTNTFDSAFFDNYIVSLMVCDTNEKLLLENGVVVDCQLFFEDKIQKQGRPTKHENLFQIRRNPFDFNYLGFVDIPKNQRLYLEFASIENALHLQNVLTKKNYSFAYYEHSELVKKDGTFEYPLLFPQTEKLLDKTFFDYNNFEHLAVFTDDPEHDHVLFVSKRIASKRDQISTFSFVCIIGLFLGLLLLLSWKRTYMLLVKSFAQRLQLTILGIVLTAFVVTGIMSIIYVQRLNTQKNQKVLREKTYSLLLLMEQTFGEEAPDEILKNPALQQKLTDFSDVFFTDIFFYDTSGQIVEKSVVDELLQSSSRNRMEPQAFHQLRKEHKNFYIQREKLNGETYYSSYVPFRNYRNELMGYLNLPHFAKQTELHQEISAFVRNYINLFVGLIIVAFLLVFLIIKRLTKPLVESERQMAWSEMAKQIAHEIKNPLTPMKLSVQQIQKAWNDQKNDFDDRMKRFSTVMVEQIDTLSSIASEFANFAQQSNVELVKIDLKNCLEKSILLMNTDHLIELKTAENMDNITILADEKQLSRAFINILKNAKQAIAEIENPAIQISLNLSETTVIIAIQDNGKGIPPEIRDRIFEPNFTTKTSGMGLGLAITKNIIERFNGTISFETGAKGTIFYIELKRVK